MEIKNHQLNTIGSSIFYHHTLTTAQNSEQTIGPEAHRQHELLYLICGNLTYQIEGRAYKVHPGDMILIGPNDIHTLQIGRDVDYERIVLHFNLELLSKMVQSMVTECPAFQWHIDSPVIPCAICKKYQLHELLTCMVAYEESQWYRNPYTIAKTLELVIQLDKIFADRKLTMTQPTTVDPLIQRMVDHIDANISQPISLDNMAAELFVSKSTLCHRFRAYMNVTINRYITVKKIYYAAELIQRGMSAAEASSAVGYRNYTTFFYNFKQIIGTAPGAGKRQSTAYRN